MIEEHFEVLLKQLAKQQAELEAKEQQLQQLEKENKKLKTNAPRVRKTNNSSIYCVTRKSGKSVYGFTIYDENFKKVRRETFATKAEAEAERRYLLDLRDKNKLSTYMLNQKQTFEDFCEIYMKKAKANFAINTVTAAEGIIKNHLSYFSNMRITKITKNTAQEWSNIYRKRIKPSAFNNSLKLAKAIWNNAISEDCTDLQNPFMNIKPINIKKECKTRDKVRINKQQADLLISTAKEMYNDYTPYIIATAIYTAMREGEILGLMWSDIDFKNNTISIQRQVQKIPKKILKEILQEHPELTEKDLLLTDRLKTEASKDIIPVPTKVITLLKEYRKKVMANENCNDLCFCKPNGLPLIARDFVRYRFEKVLKAVFGDSKYMHFHELRGSCATILHMEGVPSKIIQGLLRHEKLATTEDIYIEVTKTSKEIANYIEAAFTA